MVIKQASREIPQSERISSDTEAVERDLQAERATLGRMASARESLFANGASEDEILAHDEHTRRVEIRIKKKEIELGRLRETLAQAFADEEDAKQKIRDADEARFIATYEAHIRKFDELAMRQKSELLGAAEIEKFFKDNNLNSQKLQSFRDNRYRDIGSPERQETKIEYVIDDSMPNAFYEKTPQGVAIWGPYRRRRERLVTIPACPAQPLPPLRSLLDEIVLPALMAADEPHWDKLKWRF